MENRKKTNMLIRKLNEGNLYPKRIAEISFLKNISTLRIYLLALPFGANMADIPMVGRLFYSF